MTINFHHDAVTGTHFPEVGHWYDTAMLNALDQNSKYLAQVTKLEAARQGLEIDGFHNCYHQIYDATDPQIKTKDS